ncbi:MAG: DNA-protecting protein DprA [Bacteroidota bacterium]|nr:DNA-protecting protein DprA [Bacteroidota bacterium]
MKKIKHWQFDDILRLDLTKGISTQKVIEIVEQFDSFNEFLNSRNVNLGKLESSELFEHTKDISEQIIRQHEICENNSFNILTYWDEKYPLALKDIPYPPVVLYVNGELQKSDSLAIAIVGTRACSVYGRLTAERFASKFSASGIVVVSGLANGIDTTAHLAAVNAGGITYSVIASGLDQISPQHSRRNAEKIVETGGAIISEYPCGTVACPGYFPQRNRIISGISRATVVIESGSKGGALITARFAFDQGREVFAVPGNITQDKSAGTNMLIKKDIASIALSPDSVLEDLGIVKENTKLFKDKPPLKLSESEQIIMDKLNFEPQHFDDIARATELSVSEILVKLLNLEFKGLVRQLPGKHYIKNG